MRCRLSAAGLAFVLLLAVACGDDGGEDEGATTTTTTTDPAPGTTAAPPATSAPGPTDLPGEPIDTFPYEGATLAVVGVAADDVLNVRAGPGVDFDVVTTLEPLFSGAVATGNNRQLESGAIWAEIEADGATGWANTAFLLQPGDTTDDTARLYPTPADRPSEPTMEALADAVAADVASTDPPSGVTIVDGPSVGDLGEVTVDVIGLADDAVGGLRLHLFAEPTGSGFTLRTVESTVLCTRGVDAGACL